MKIDGRTRTLNFERFSDVHMYVVRHVVFDWFSRIDAKTVATYASSIAGCAHSETFIEKAVSIDPASFGLWWAHSLQTDISSREAGAFKALISSLCRLVVEPWSRDYSEFVSSLPSPPKSRFNVVRAADCFIPMKHQAQFAHWLDDTSERASSAESLSDKEVQGACILGLACQYGLRPVQMAGILVDDVTCRGANVYLRFGFAKQRDGAPRHTIRRVKAEWCAPWIEFLRRRSSVPATADVHPQAFLKLAPWQASLELSDLCLVIAGKRYTPNDFRHSGAQRVADAGGSIEEIQDFLMHSTDGSALVYYRGSPAQAAKVNAAMGLSTIYSRVAQLAHEGVISKQALEQLEGDRQIGGVPHGMPIAGIGACTVGQMQCKLNPVLSCYHCRKFLPVADPEPHKQVVTGLRKVVREFLDVSSDVDASPAYGQLRATIEAASQTAISVGRRGRKA